MKTLIGAGLSQSISQQGGRFYYMEGKGAIEVKIQSGGDTRRFVLLPGKGIAMREGDRFMGLEIVNLLNESQEVEFEVSDREVFDNRITGTVSVLNSDKTRTDEKKAFMDHRGDNDFPGFYSGGMIENPVGSGKIVYFERAVLSAGDPVFIRLYVVDDAAAFRAEVDATTSVITTPRSGENKYIGSELSVSETRGFRLDYFPGLSGAGGRVSVAQVFVSAAPFDYKLTEPVRVGEGQAVVMVAIDPGISSQMSMEWFEESVL